MKWLFTGMFIIILLSMSISFKIGLIEGTLTCRMENHENLYKPEH